MEGHRVDRGGIEGHRVYRGGENGGTERKEDMGDRAETGMTRVSGYLRSKSTWRLCYRDTRQTDERHHSTNSKRTQ